MNISIELLLTAATLAGSGIGAYTAIMLRIARLDEKGKYLEKMIQEYHNDNVSIRREMEKMNAKVNEVVVLIKEVSTKLSSYEKK